MDSVNKKFLKRGLILATILFVIFYAINEISRMAVYNSRYEIINHINYMPEDSLDILVMGNSHAQEGINAPLISDILDKKTINFSFSQQQTATAYYFLEKAFKKQAPEVVIVEAYTLIQEVQGGSEFIPLTSAKIKHLVMLEEEGSLVSCLFPIAANHNFWARKNPFDAFMRNIRAGENEVPPFFSSMIMSDKAISRHKTYDSVERARTLFEYRLDHLLKIKELCMKNGAELIITMLPLYKTLVERLDYDGLYYNAIKNFCDENGIVYYDMNKQSATEWTYKYFREQDYTHNTHLNTYGQILASTELAQYLSEEVGFLNITEYKSPIIETADFLTSYDSANNLLIIDDCPNKLNAALNSEVKKILDDMGIVLKEKEKIVFDPEEAANETKEDKNEKSSIPDVYFVSGGTAYNDYTLPKGLSYAEDGVTIYELTSDGDPVRQVVARWDEFTTAIIR